MATTKAASTPRKRATTRASATAKPKATKAKVVKSTTAKITPQTTTKAPVQGVTAAEAAPGQVLSKKELFARLKARTPGVKGSDTRQVMEAMLDELGEALIAGQNLKLQPLGTVKVQRQKAVGGADMVVLKLRRKKRNPEGKDPLAEAAE
jgi:nucleoid DNA-binding protein